MSKISESKVLLINYLDENELKIFHLSDIVAYFKGNDVNIRGTVEALVKDGILKSLQKGLYCRPSFHDEFVLAYYLAPKGAVAYWSALHLHGLTTQFANTIFVQSPTFIKNKEVMNVWFQFIKVRPSKAMGYQLEGRGNNQFKITNLEKTIVDCFDAIGKAVDWSELIKALYKAKMRNGELIEACEAVANVSVIKRLGYLVEVLKIKNLRTFEKYALQKVNKKYNDLDPSSPSAGSYLSKWRLRLNVSEDDILQQVKNYY
jgi:predicted transcriptional regulator of viral defense system